MINANHEQQSWIVIEVVEPSWNLQKRICRTLKAFFTDRKYSIRLLQFGWNLWHPSNYRKSSKLVLGGEDVWVRSWIQIGDNKPASSFLRIFPHIFPRRQPGGFLEDFDTISDSHPGVFQMISTHISSGTLATFFWRKFHRWGPRADFHTLSAFFQWELGNFPKILNVENLHQILHNSQFTRINFTG